MLTTSLVLAALACPSVQRADTVRARLVATIGEVSPTPFLLGEISGIAIDDSGRIYVSDFQEPRVVVFSSRGRHLGTVGRKGQGPGEFTAPTGPVVGPDGALYVRNMEQVMRFVRDPGTGLLSRFDRSFVGPTMAPWRSKLPSVIDRSGRFHFPLEVGRPDGLTHYASQRYGRDGKKLDSIPVPLYPTSRSSWASIMIAQNTGRVIPGLSMVPFHPVPVWAVTSRGTVVSGPADRYELMETDSLGRTIRTIRRAIPAERIPPAVRGDSLRALRRRIDSLPVPVSQVRGASEEVKARRLPEYFPFYRSLVGTHTHELWVRRWTPPTMKNSTVMDVFGANGAYVKTVVLPADCANEPAIAVRGKAMACMVVDPETGAESVVVSVLD